MGKLISEIGGSPVTVNAETLFETESGAGTSGHTTAELLRAFVLGSYVFIDMDSDDYTMTVEEACSPIKIVFNGVAGKTLTWPSACDNLAPPRQLMSFSGCEPGVILASETGGITSVVLAGYPVFDVLFLPPVGILVYPDGKVLPREITGTSYTVVAADCGAVLRFTNAAGITLTINSDVALAGFNFAVIQAGAGQVTFAGTSTRRNYDGHTKTAGQYAVVGFVCDTAGEFNFSGKTA